MVFEKARQLVLVIQASVEMLAHGAGMTFTQAVVQTLVVSIVESLLLHRPFPIPVDLGHELEVRMFAPHGLGCLRPEELSPDAPSAFEHIGQEQHSHVAAHAVALPGDSLQLADHRLLQLRVAVVELQRVGPAIEVRVAAVSEHHSPVFCLHPAVVPRHARQIIFVAMDKVIRVLIDPRMIRRHVVGNKVEHQLQSALFQPLSQSCERRVAAQIAMDGIVLDGEP